MLFLFRGFCFIVFKEVSGLDAAMAQGAHVVKVSRYVLFRKLLINLCEENTKKCTLLDYFIRSSITRTRLFTRVEDCFELDFELARIRFIMSGHGRTLVIFCANWLLLHCIAYNF